ncbi:MAG TPA: transporter [Providencia sp.]|uniref:type II secretion system F family protein n=1 Tax=Providencia sp. TaxID=589 RepID=UPI000E826BBB|nr:type II secretion system F family protein [Providencia sp.]MBP6082984.1 type II secretion system F family protein [Providencia sp.]HBO21545.1 transporter [Providencia sp.]
MFIYSYTAINSHNDLIKDTLIAKNKKQALLIIIENNLIPLKIKLKAIFNLNKLNLNYRIHFFHQLSILTSSGINLLQCLSILKSNCQLPLWNYIISCSINNLKKGESFAKNLKQHPTIFDSTTLSLIIIAEKTGQYENSFTIITTMLEHNIETTQIIKKALRYPITLIIFSIILLSIMLLYVIPQFENIYSTFQHELPFLTQIMITISNRIRDEFYLFFILISLFILCIIKFRTEFKKHLHQLSTIIPYFGQLIQFHNLSIYFLTLSSTLKAGLPLPECLNCAIGTITNNHYHKDSQFIHSTVIKGESLSSAMNQTLFFPSLAIQLISIAEETDKLQYFTQYLFKYYSKQYADITKQRLKNLEPILLVLISSLIGVIMLAMYLPIFNLGNVITGV